MRPQVRPRTQHNACCQKEPQIQPKWFMRKWYYDYDYLYPLWDKMKMHTLGAAGGY